MFWNQHVERIDMMQELAVLARQACVDLSGYTCVAPGNFTYEWRARTSIRGWEFKAQFLAPDASRDLAHEQSVADEIIDIHGARERETPSEDDLNWQSQVTLQVGPDPDRSETQPRGMALDYGMRAGKVRIKARRPLLDDGLRRLGLDKDPGDRRPQDQKIVLLTSAEIVRASRGAS